MSLATGFTGGCTSIWHLVVQYPKVAACAAILGLGTNVALTDEQMAECDAKIAQCQVQAPPIVVVPPVVKTEPVKPVKPVDYCANAPVITRGDLFVSTGTPYPWRHAGADPVRGNAATPYLIQLQYTEAERRVFLDKISRKDGVMTTLKNGDVVGLSTSGSGKLHYNATVRFNPVAPKGSGFGARDNRMRVYTYKHLVRMDGDCFTRTVVLLEPFVCQNWSRRSDVLIPYRKAET